MMAFGTALGVRLRTEQQIQPRLHQWIAPDTSPGSPYEIFAGDSQRIPLRSSAEML